MQVAAGAGTPMLDAHHCAQLVGAQDRRARRREARVRGRLVWTPGQWQGVGGVRRGRHRGHRDGGQALCSNCRRGAPIRSARRRRRRQGEVRGLGRRGGGVRGAVDRRGRHRAGVRSRGSRGGCWGGGRAGCGRRRCIAGRQGRLRGGGGASRYGTPPGAHRGPQPDGGRGGQEVIWRCGARGVLSQVRLGHVPRRGRGCIVGGHSGRGSRRAGRRRLRAWLGGRRRRSRGVGGWRAGRRLSRLRGAWHPVRMCVSGSRAGRPAPPGAHRGPLPDGDLGVPGGGKCGRGFMRRGGRPQGRGKRTRRAGCAGKRYRCGAGRWGPRPGRGRGGWRRGGSGRGPRRC